MATEDLGNLEWERSKISQQDINLLKKLGINRKQDSLRFPKEESYPTPPMEYRGQKAKEVDDTGFKLWYTGTTSNKNGVGILVNKSLRDGVVDVKRQGDRMILVKLVVGDLVLNVISAYAPQVGHNESTKREFWEGLEDLVRRVPIGEKLFIGGDLNGHVGTSNTGFERVHGGFGYGIRNQEGEDVLSFALAYDMVVANTLFRKRESHLVTFSSGLHSSQIDFVLSRREDRRACIDCKVIPGESVVPQHKLVVADFRFRIRVQRGKRAKVARTKWWKLKGEASQAFRERVIKEGPWEEGGDANMMWTSMATCLRKVAVEEFGVTKGSRREAKDTWWWNDEVQKVIREKKDCFRCLYLDRSAANMEKYKVAKKAAKRAVSEARGRAYEDLYQRLNTKEGERDIYKMAKFRERKTRDVNEVKCIKDGDDQLLVKDEAIKRRWREYFDNLYNGEAESSTIELDDSFDDTSMCFVRRIQESEVKEALRRMKGGKAMGPDETLAEVNKRADALATKLEQSEKARKKAEADAATVEDLRKRLHQAETSLSDNITHQSAREKEILTRLESQSRRFVRKTQQDYELESPEGDPLLDALSLLEIHGDEAREGLAEAGTGLSRLFPYFFKKKEVPAPFVALAKCFNSQEDLGLQLRQEGLKVGVEGIIALVADSQQDVDWARVGNTEEMETKRWQSLIKAAKPNSKKILAYLGYKPAPTPSSSKPEVK
ncbi:hypothetical protein QYE76_067297 [Lolium multiflorum]|uniref:Craniofacial development protein 2-like n=2 Tax=Lolium TaxID=4520 RepID=A0AAD8SCB1_LOLMU|nr:hypothetical protein QYE76_067297 [Lolium multiflorum]